MMYKCIERKCHNYYIDLEDIDPNINKEFIISLDLSDLYTLFVIGVINTDGLDIEELFYLLIEELLICLIDEDNKLIKRESSGADFYDTFFYNAAINGYQDDEQNDQVFFEEVNIELIFNIYEYLKQTMTSIVRGRELRIYPDQWVDKTLFLTAGIIQDGDNDK